MTDRLEPTEKIKLLLWSRSGARCSNPDCRIPLIRDGELEADPTHMAEICHIVAASDGGARADQDMTAEQRREYSNLILLCRNCHRVADTHQLDHRVELLQEWKRRHEEWVESSLSAEGGPSSSDIIYAEILDGWVTAAQVDDWLSWTSHLLAGGQPTLPAEVYENIKVLPKYLLSRLWPNTDLELENAFDNFSLVLQDFLRVFRSHADLTEDGELWFTQKFYKINEWDDERYHELLTRYEEHVDLVEDLTLELTRAANLICDRVRLAFAPDYRRAEGRLMVEFGPLSDLTWVTTAVQYSESERQSKIPYRGFEEFRTDRFSRDRCFGQPQEG